MLINENLTWENHVDALSKKIGSGVGAVNHINHSLPPSYRLAWCILWPCPIALWLLQRGIWGNCGQTLRDKLQRLQNRAARVLTNSNYDAYANILLNDLGWHNLETQRQIHKAVMVYKSLNCLVPDHMSSKFILRCDLFDCYNLRDSENKLAVRLPRTNYHRNSFCCSGAVLWKICPLM